jgi:hypothetical protein
MQVRASAKLVTVRVARISGPAATAARRGSFFGLGADHAVATPKCASKAPMVASRRLLLPNVFPVESSKANSITAAKDSPP